MKDRDNRKRKRTGILLIIMGAAAMSAALFLALYREAVSSRAASAAEETAAVLREVIPDDAENAGAAWKEGEPDVYLCGNYSCIGLLTLEGSTASATLPVTLPDGAPGNLLPVRIKGSPSGGFCIQGPGYSSVFGILSDLAEGDRVTFTDLYGFRTEYIVESADFAGDVDMTGGADLLLISRRPVGYTLVSCRRAGN